jgi:hypothetical protein
MLARRTPDPTCVSSDCSAVPLGWCELRGDRRRRGFPQRNDYAIAAFVICSSCPVQAACQAYALNHRIEHGTWGGCTSGQRAQLIPMATS